MYDHEPGSQYTSNHVCSLHLTCAQCMGFHGSVQLHERSNATGAWTVHHELCMVHAGLTLCAVLQIQLHSADG